MAIKKHYRRLLILIFLFIGNSFIQLLSAQTEDWKSVDWQIGVGQTYLYDEYLSPLSHEGLGLKFSNTSLKPLKWGLPDNLEKSYDGAVWFNQLRFSLDAATCESVASTNLLYGNIAIHNSLFRKIISKPQWCTSIGAFADINGGGRYCSQNGNNPGSLDLIFNLGIAAMADYDFQFLGKSLKLRYEGNLALGGLAFSPEYAESYYEIFYLNNHHNIVKFTSLANKQDWQQQLSIDLPLANHKKSSFRISYVNEGRISLLNNIRIRNLSDYFSVGYIHYFNVL